MTFKFSEHAVSWRTVIPVLTIIALCSGYAVRPIMDGPSPFSVEAYAAVTGASQHIVSVVRSDFSGTNLWGEVDIEGLPAPLPPDAPLNSAAIDAMVRKAIELACIDDGGLSAYFDPDDWVCLVIDAGYWATADNPGAHDTPGGIVDPRLVAAFLDLLASEKRGGRISLFARAPSEFWQSTWNGRYDGLSYASLLQDIAARYPEIAFDIIGKESFSSKDIEVAGERYAVPEALEKCRKFVSIATLKLHQATRVSMNVLNYFQFISGNHPAQVIRPADREVLESDAVNVFAYRPPRFALVDGITGSAITNSGDVKTFRGNLVLAGKDPVAVDAAGTMLLGRNPWDVGHFHRAAERGTGTFDPDSMDLRGTPFRDAVTSITAVLPEPNDEYVGRALRRWLVNGFYEGKDIGDMPLEDEPFLYPEPDDEEGGRVWTEYVSPGDRVDLSAALPDASEKGVAYVYTRFLSSVQEEGYAWFTGSGNYMLFFNDEEIHSGEDGAGVQKIPIPVKRGYNHVLIKLARTETEYGFSFQVVGPENDGNSMSGLKFLEQ